MPPAKVAPIKVATVQTASVQTASERAAEKKQQVTQRRQARIAAARQREREKAAARDAARAERKRQARARLAERKAEKVAAYVAATATMAEGGEAALRAAALVLKTKGAKQSDRKRAASVMGLIGGSIGGFNRAANLTPERRTEIARKAGLARQLKARTAREEAAAALAAPSRTRRRAGA